MIRKKHLLQRIEELEMSIDDIQYALLKQSEKIIKMKETLDTIVAKNNIEILNNGLAIFEEILSEIEKETKPKNKSKSKTSNETKKKTTRKGDK